MLNTGRQADKVHGTMSIPMLSHISKSATTKIIMRSRRRAKMNFMMVVFVCSNDGDFLWLWNRYDGNLCLLLALEMRHLQGISRTWFDLSQTGWLLCKATNWTMFMINMSNTAKIRRMSIEYLSFDLIQTGWLLCTATNLIISKTTCQTLLDVV